MMRFREAMRNNLSKSRFNGDLPSNTDYYGVGVSDNLLKILVGKSHINYRAQREVDGIIAE